VPHAGALDGPALEVLRAALPDAWAPTALETFARCPFRLFAQLALRVPDRAGAELDADARDEGSLLHAILERFVAGRASRGAWPPRGDPADVEEVQEIARAVFARFEAEGRTGDPAVWTARREAVLGRIGRVVRAEAEVQDGLVPALLEHAFGGDAPGAAPALELAADGEVVRLRGRIDRVDAGPDRLLVIDYKSGKDGKAHAGKLSPEAFGTESFQVPAYLLVAARDLPGRRRLSATYAMLGAASRVPAVELDADDPVLVASVPAVSATPTSTPPPSALDAEQQPAPGGTAFATAVVETVRQIRAGRFPVRPGGCEHCPHRAICRLDVFAEEDEP
jgi:ATP-dependent helicase/DNAse subunit B